MPATPEALLTDRAYLLSQAAALLVDYVASVAGGADHPRKRLRYVCSQFEEAVTKLRGACLDVLGAEADVDPEDPAELVGHLLARSAANEAAAPDLRDDADASYRIAVGY